MLKMNVEILRKSGAKVRVTHKRWYLGGKQMELLTRTEAEEKGLVLDGDGPLTCGGLTRVEVTTPNSENFIGEAVCSANQNYNRKLGVYFALGRAMNQRVNEDTFFKRKQAQAIVNNVLFDLHGRDSVGSTLDNLPQNVYEDMEEQLVELVQNQL